MTGGFVKEKLKPWSRVFKTIFEARSYSRIFFNAIELAEASLDPTERAWRAAWKSSEAIRSEGVMKAGQGV